MGAEGDPFRNPGGGGRSGEGLEESKPVWGIITLMHHNSVVQVNYQGERLCFIQNMYGSVTKQELAISLCHANAHSGLALRLHS